MPPFNSSSSSLPVVQSLMTTLGAHCPCHSPTPAASLAMRLRPALAAAVPSGHAHHGHHHPNGSACTHGHQHHVTGRSAGRPFATSSEDADVDYAFEMATSTIRYGRGATREVGMDMANINAKKVAVFTDAKVATLPPVRAALDSLVRAKVPHVVYDRVRVEPTDSSFLDAIRFARAEQPDAFVAVGGGSVIDTAKAANLYLCHPDADLLDFVNAPIGKGLPVMKTLKPFVAVPTTAGTGSETTGVAIFDYEPKSFKTGIASRMLKPTLGIVDPLNTRTLAPEVHVSAGLD
ncbi:Hydroxyacid-oxoacid transhydrogenase, mitochondrial, partial [Cladochytrium tenue]